MEHIGGLIQLRFNRYLDGVVYPRITLAGRSLNNYKFWVYTGVAAGTIILFPLCYLNNISLSIMGALVLIVASLSFALFKSTKVIGRSYPFLNWARRGVYHFQIVALIFTIAFLKIMKEPLLPYLDILVVALLLYQAFGRIGCLMAGCCHGRPHDWGVCYGNRYDHTGYFYFTERVRLFPVQLVESSWLFFLAIIAIIISGDAYPPGENFSLYIVGYGAGRFFFEFFRADLERIYIGDFSEPQWTAVLLTIAIVGIELAGFLHFRRWHAAILLAMLTVIIIMLLRRRQTVTRQRILHPDHILEVFRATGQAIRRAVMTGSLADAQNISSATTSLGIQIRFFISSQDSESRYWYRFSRKDGILAYRLAKVLSALIIRLRHTGSHYTLTESEPGLFQLDIHTEQH